MTSDRLETPGADAARGALNTIALGLAGLYLWVFAAGNATHQWDFKTYVLAARAALAGLDPYAIEDLGRVAGRAASFPFVYPPIALLPFAGVAALGPSAAPAFWIGFKLLLLAGTIALWRTRFVPGAGVLPLALIAVFGWNGAALVDLRSGNVALVENALLWLGFLGFATGRRAAFAACVVAAACFKLAPAVFLLLLLVPVRARDGRDGGPSLHLLAVSALALVALVWGPFLVAPISRWSGFLAHVPDATVLGGGNPSALGLITVLATTVDGAHAASLAAGGFALYAALLLAASLGFLRRAWRERDPMRWVMIAVFLELLLAPRPMAYGFARLAPAPLFLAPRRLRGRTGALVLASILSAQGLVSATHHHGDGLVVVYAPLLLTLALWLWIVSDREP